MTWRPVWDNFNVIQNLSDSIVSVLLAISRTFMRWNNCWSPQQFLERIDFPKGFETMVRFLCVWGTRILWVLPFLVIPGIFALFWTDRIPGLPDDLASRGQFGDSFGVLNSLFTGLGFAGLLVTIGLQQRQIRRQSEDFQAQLHDIAVRRYEDNLFRLLALYHDALSSVISTRDGHTATGRDVLRQATEWLLKSIRQEGVNSVPHEIQTRFRAGALTAEDRDVLDFLYYRNFWHLNYGLNRQGRLLVNRPGFDGGSNS